MQSKTSKNEGIIYEANCKSINKQTTKEQVLNFIANNIFPTLHNCIIKDDINIFPQKSMATFQLKDPSHINSLNKIINNKIQHNLIFNGKKFILNCRNSKPKGININNVPYEQSPSNSKQIYTCTPSSNTAEVLTYLDLSTSHSVSRSPVQINITPIYPSLSSSPYHGSNTHTFSSALAKCGLHLINQASSNSATKTKKPSPHIKGITKANKPIIDKETEFKMIEPISEQQAVGKITHELYQMTEDKIVYINPKVTDAQYIPTQISTDNINATQISLKQQRRSSGSSNSSGHSHHSQNSKYSLYSSSSSNNSHDSHDSHRSQFKNKIKNYMKDKDNYSMKSTHLKRRKKSHISNDKNRVSKRAIRSAQTAKYDQIRQHYVVHAENINQRKRKYFSDRNKAFKKWTKLWQSQNGNVTSPVEVQTLIDFARMSLGYYSNWLMMKNNTNNRWIKYFVVMKDFNLFLFKNEYTPTTLNDVVNRDYLAISLAHFKNIKQCFNRNEFCIETLGSKTALRFKCESIQHCQQWVNEIDYQMHVIDNLCCNQSVRLECADSKASIWIPVAPLAFLNPYQQVVNNNKLNDVIEPQDDPEEDLELLCELEGIVNEEIENMLEICEQFNQFKKQLLHGEYKPTQCPGSKSGTGNNQTNNGSGCMSNGNQINNGSGSSRNNKHNGNNKGRGNGNNNNRSNKPNKYNKYAQTTSMNCNHLHECNDCIQTVKYWQNMVAGQAQHIQHQTKTHLSFQKLLAKAITNTAKKKSKRKKQRLKINQIHIRQNNEANSDPILLFQNSNNKTYISNKIIQNIKQNAIKAPQYIRNFMNASIELQQNMDEIKEDRKIMDFGYIDKNTNEHLYCVLQKKNHANYKWKMEDKLFTTNELSKLSLPPTTTSQFAEKKNKKTQVYVNKIKTKMNAKIIQEMINKCKWNKLPLYIRKNNEKRITLSITPELLGRHIKMQSSDNINLIPIIGYNNNGTTRIDFVWIIRIDKDINIGISLEYNEKYDIVRINGIYVDKNYLLQQHYLLSPYHMNKCNCLNKFETIINDIHIGNPDDLYNKVKDYKQRYETLKEFYNSFRHENESKESLEKGAENIMNMHDNGDLFKEITTTPSVLSTASSVSICPSTVSSNNTSPPPIIINDNKSIQNSKYLPSQHMSLNNGYNCLGINQNYNGLPATVFSVINNNFNVATTPSPYVNNAIQNMNFLLQPQVNVPNNTPCPNSNSINYKF